MKHLLNRAGFSNRMDSGRFESVLKPYKFHQVLRSLFVPLQLATDARGLQFVTNLDTNIDQVRAPARSAEKQPSESTYRRSHDVHYMKQWANPRSSSCVSSRRIQMSSGLWWETKLAYGRSSRT